MALRSNADTAFTSRTSGMVNHNAAYTVCFWAKLSSDRDQYTHFWAASDTTTDTYEDSDFVGTDNTGTNLRGGVYVAAAGTDTVGAALTVGTWYHIAVKRTSATDWRMYVNGVQSGITVTRDITGRNATLGEFFHRLNGTTYFCDGVIAHYKAWDVALTDAQIAAEMRTITPKRWTNLVGWTPFISSVKADALKSRVGGDWTENGTLVIEQGPPVSWGASPATVLKADAAVAQLPIPDVGEAPSAYKDTVRDLVMRARSELAFALDSPPSLYASAAQSVAVAQASETDTAQAVGKAKVKAVGQAVETDTSIAITARKSKNLAQATETDTAQAVARAKSKSVAQSTETDTAQAIARLKTKQVAQATETDLAQPITRSGAKNIAVVQAVEVDTAQPVARSKAKTFAQAFETDSAISVTRLKSRVLGIASETDTAQVVAKTKVKAIGQAAEIETALAITRLKRQTLQQATELDLAQAVTHTKAKGVAQAVETDTALSITQFGVVSGYLRGTIKVYPTLGVGSINIKPAITGTINVN